MNDDLFGMETMPDAVEAKESGQAPRPFGVAPGAAETPGSPVGIPGLDSTPLENSAGVAGVDFPQMGAPAAPPSGALPGFAQAPSSTEATQFPDFAPAPISAPPVDHRSAPRTISMGGGGLGSLGKPRPSGARPAALIVPSAILVPGLAAALYLWLIVGTWPLAAVAAALSVVGGLFCWVLLK